MKISLNKLVLLLSMRGIKAKIYSVLMKAQMEVSSPVMTPDRTPPVTMS